MRAVMAGLVVALTLSGTCVDSAQAQRLPTTLGAGPRAVFAGSAVDSSLLGLGSRNMLAPHLLVPSAIPGDRTGRQRVARGLIGGLAGAVGGVGVCTFISVSVFDGSGCTARGNTQFAIGGFVLGFVIGMLT